MTPALELSRMPASLERILFAAEARGEMADGMATAIERGTLESAAALEPDARANVVRSHRTYAEQLRDDVAAWRRVLEAARSFADAIEADR